MGADRERESLRATFDRSSDLYHRARPDYPDELIERLVSVTGLRAGDQLLEIGCGTGKATLPLARRGFHITGLELGPQLAEAASANLSSFSHVDIIEGSFEEWIPPTGARFDVVLAATAWHWIDPAVRYRRAAESLRSGGHLAFWTAGHVYPRDGDPFFVEIQDVYDEIGEGLPPGFSWPRPGELEEHRGEIELSGFFDVVEVCHFDWEVSYDADGYIDLLNTFSGHIAMPQWKRDRLNAEIRDRLSARPEGSMRRHWGAVLHVARRRD